MKRTEGEEQVALDNFEDLLKGRADEDLSGTELNRRINEHKEEQKRKQKAQEEEKHFEAKKTTALRPLLKEHSLKNEDGFDLRRYLKRLKALDPSKEAQLHYLVKISVEATDNNVETGPATGRNKAPFAFLVVSENELLSQVAIEEEVLRDRLDKAAFKLRNAKTTIDDQALKLAATGSDYTLVSLRVDDVRKALLDGGTAAREVHSDYRRIQKELEVNRVKKTKVEDVRDKIVEPLGEIVEPSNGNFAVTEGAVDKLYAALDEDISAKRGEENRPKHALAAREAAQHLDRLLERLNQVLIAMDEGVVESKLLESIVNIERGQRRIAEISRLLRIQEEEKLFNDLTK
jgi:hypothetical protein